MSVSRWRRIKRERDRENREREQREAKLAEREEFNRYQMEYYRMPEYKSVEEAADELVDKLEDDRMYGIDEPILNEASEALNEAMDTFVRRCRELEREESNGST